MTLWQFLLAAAGVLALGLALVRSGLRSRWERKNRDDLRKLELVLQPRETVKVICPQKKGRVILTSKRVLFDTPQGFQAVSIKTIKKVQGTNEAGNRTTSISRMARITIKAEKEYSVQNTSEEFPEFAKQLIKKTKPKKKK